MVNTRILVWIFARNGFCIFPEFPLAILYNFICNFWYFHLTTNKFIRSPIDTSYDKLKDIPSFKKYDNKGYTEAFEINTYDNRSIIRFNNTMDEIDEIGRYLNHGVPLEEYEKEALFLVFIHSALQRSGDTSIFITNNSTILKHKSWFESHRPGGPLNIVTIEEAKEIMDLFAKYQNTYYITHNYICNKGFWYKLSLLTRIPRLLCGDSDLAALFNRFIYLLMSADEIGYQYYSNVNNDTATNTIYHFNYSVLLMTGIFDSLATRTRKQYNLKYKGDNIPSRTSLNSMAGKHFLKALSSQNKDLRVHIDKHANFIKLIYKLRERIVHRDMLPEAIFQVRGRDEKWEAHFIEIDQDLANLLSLCNDKEYAFTPFTEWGVYIAYNSINLIPFFFVKSAIKTLCIFSNQYLTLLGFKDDGLEISKNKDNELIKAMELFEINSLGI